MKTKQLLIFLSLFFISQTLVFAQTYSFKVLVNKGKNEVKAGNSWQPIKVGVSLTDKDEIKIASNAYMGLVHVTGKPLELKEPKTYKVSDLAKRISSGSNVLAKYTDFILSSNSTQKNNLEATGSVHRGPESVIHMNLPKKAEQTVFFNARQVISWDTVQRKGPYVVTFSTLFDDELKTIETNENRVEVDLSAPEFRIEDNVIVHVESKGDGKESERFTLKRLSDNDRHKIEKLFNEIASATSEETALNYYLRAAFFEENRLLIDASTCYMKAIELAPDPSIYQQSYKEFLLRTGIAEAPPSDK